VIDLRYLSVVSQTILETYARFTTLEFVLFTCQFLRLFIEA